MVPIKQQNRWGIGLTIAGIIVYAILILSSCSGSRKVVKSETKTDSSSVVKTETKKDSIVNSSTTKVVTENTDNDVTTKDDYIEETTYYYGKDSSNMPTVTHKVTKRSGSTTIIDKSKKKTELNVKDTTASNYKENKKEDIKATVKKEESNKKVDSEHSILSRGNVIILALILLIIAIGIWAYKKFVK